MNAQTDYQMAYRALRRWNKAAYKGASPRQTTDLFRNIKMSYPTNVFNAALISLMDSKAYAMYRSNN